VERIGLLSMVEPPAVQFNQTKRFHPRLSLWQVDVLFCTMRFSDCLFWDHLFKSDASLTGEITCGREVSDSSLQHSFYR
jgi:hypothetical protein